MHFLNKKQEKELLQKAGRKTRSKPRKRASESNFHTPQNGKMRGENEGFERERQGKFRNNITILFNIKTKDGGRTWKTRRESVAFKDTTLRKITFHKQTISYCLSIHYTNTTFHLKKQIKILYRVIKGQCH